MKKVVSTLLASMIVFSFSTSVGASNIAHQNDVQQYSAMSRYVAVAKLTASTSISGSQASSTASYQFNSSSYSGTLSIVLERSINKISWSEVASWSEDATKMANSFSKSKYVSGSGYYYRTVVTLDVYNSSGNYVETVTKTSTAAYK